MTAASRYASKARSRARARAAGGVGGTMEQILEDLADSASDLSPAWPAVGEVWAERQRKVFATGSFGRWAPLKAATILRKRREGATTEPLIRTGSLMGEVSSPTPRAQSSHFVVFGPQRGAVIDYAKYHLHGNGVPQRNPVPRLTPTERKRMIEKIQEYMGLAK